jgi:type II secretory pathway component PulC
MKNRRYRLSVQVFLFISLIGWYPPLQELVQASTLTVEIRGSLFDIKADNVPLMEILKKISEKTGVVLKLDGPVKRFVSCNMLQVSLDDAIQELLRNRNYILSYKNGLDNQLVPSELWIMSGDSTEKPGVTVSGIFVKEDNSLSLKPGVTKKIEREEISSELSNENNPYGQIKGVPYQGQDMNDRGVSIIKISDDSFFQQIGLQKGDVISRVNGTQVNSVEDLVQGLRAVSAEQTPIIRIERKGVNNLMDPIYINTR